MVCRPDGGDVSYSGVTLVVAAAAAESFVRVA